MKRLTVLEIPGGKLGLYVDLERAILTDLEVHTSAKIRVRLERQSDSWFHIHLFRRNRCIRTWDVVIGLDGTVNLKTIHADTASLEKYTYGANRQRHAYVRTPSSPEGELKAQAAQL